MANMVQVKKKIAILHRYPKQSIKETNAAFPFLLRRGMDVLTFKSFNRISRIRKLLKSIAWIFYAPLLVAGKRYDVIYCDDSFPFYAALVKLVSPRSRVVKRLGDLHLMYYTSGILYWILHALEKIEWRMIDEIIAISPVMRDHVSKEIGRRVELALDPVNPEDFKCRKENHGTVMFHGLLTRNKNVDILIRAAKVLSEITFVVVGDGPDRARLEKMAPANVIFKGWIPFKKIVQTLSTCAIGVALRSDNPGNDFVVTSPFLQYGVLGKPCLVTKRKVFGLYPWQFRGTSDLVNKIIYLLTNPEEGEKLRKYVIRRHNAEDIAGKIWRVLAL